MAVVIEIDLYTLPGGPLVTRRYTSGAPFKTRPTDSPPNTYIEARLADQVITRRDLFEKATTYGAVSPGVGEITLFNTDGALDDLAGFSPREARLWWSAVDNAAFPSGWTPLAVWQCGRPVIGEAEVRLPLKDRMVKLDKPLLSAKYAGDNVAPGGLEGTAQDLKGQRKPRVIGRVLNISPPCVNTSRLIYQVSDRACSVTAVYDRGAGLTAGAAYAALADIQTTAPAAGQYRAYAGPEGTYIRLGSSPASLTADAQTTETRAAALAAQVATDMGLSFAAADVSTLSAIAAPVGVWATDDITAREVMEQLLGSIGAWFSCDAFGALRAGRLTAPDASGTAIPPWRIKSVTVEPTADEDGGMPVWRVTLGYARNNTLQDDIAGLAADRAAWLAQEYRQATAEDAARKTAWPEASEHVADTALLAEADAIAEAQRRLALYTGRSVYSVLLETAPDTAALDIGQTVLLRYRRYGLAGRLLRIIGLTHNHAIGETTLRLWG